MPLLHFYQTDDPAGSLFGQPDNTDDFWSGALVSAARFALASAITTTTALSTTLAYNLQQQDEIPAGSLFGQADEDFWRNPTFPVVTTLSYPQQFTFEQKETAVLFGQPDEDLWVNPTFPVVGSLQYPPQWTFEQHTPLSISSFQPDEDFWQNPVWPVVSTFQFQSQTAFEQSEQAVLWGQPDEDFWINPVYPSVPRLYQQLPLLYEAVEIVPFVNPVLSVTVGGFSSTGPSGTVSSAPSATGSISSSTVTGVVTGKILR